MECSTGDPCCALGALANATRATRVAQKKKGADPFIQKGDRGLSPCHLSYN